MPLHNRSSLLRHGERRWYRRDQARSTTPAGLQTRGSLGTQQHPRSHPLGRAHDRLHRCPPADRHARIRAGPQRDSGLPAPTTTSPCASRLTPPPRRGSPRATTHALPSRGHHHARYTPTRRPRQRDARVRSAENGTKTPRTPLKSLLAEVLVRYSKTSRPSMAVRSGKIPTTWCGAGILC
jgi:hypothetical protein